MTEAGKLPPPLPPRLDWFVHTQMSQLTRDGIPEWFHGTISREAAENLLESQPLGSFLIRVSHSHVGYTLSYRAESCCRHLMIKLLEDGSFVIPGQEVAHASLDALVAFHLHNPVQRHGEELLSQPCGQKDPENVDYEDLFLYSSALAEELCSAMRDPWDPQRSSPCQRTTPEEPKDKRPSAEKDHGPTQGAPAALGETRHGLWKNLKMLPQAGKRVQQQLKAQLTAVSLSSLWDAGRPEVTQNPRARLASQGHQDSSSSSCRDSCPASLLRSHSQPCRDKPVSSEKVTRSSSCSDATTRDRGWHRALVRALSSHASKSEPKDSQEPEDWLPEEYRQPPPFAPGYC
ncbi:hematopoietic SH2 domain-containing protein isoform X1 [Ochotona princeps]|uniref:hematopoietic SH2 domain-containing protein isoform X1 n=1 Tax=Ochotona princeps TaxID=9978 RepID=UPI002715074D|nr:hematopoietic SH2 domain-containing protein isoform X1 [Ochotona princeps]